MLKLLMIGEEGFVGGAEIATSRLLSGLKERCVQCAAVVPANSHYWRILHERGIRLFPCGLNELKRTFIRGYPVLREISGLRRAIAEFNPTIIHADAPWAAFFCLPAAKRFDVPVVCALHSYPEAHRAFKRMVFAFLKRYVIGRCECFVVFSDHMLEEVVRRYGFPAEKVCRVNYGIDEDRITPRMSRAEWRMRNDLPTDATVFMVVTRIHPEKGIMDLVEAAKLVSEACENIFFVVAGEEVVSLLENLGFTAELHRRLETLGIANRFRFLGFQDDVGSILRGCDVLVHPSHREPFGLAVAEASLAGLPVVASSVGGIPEMVVNGGTGFLVEPRNANQLAEKMLLLAQNHGLRREMGERGITRTRARFQMPQMLDDMLEIYERAAGRDQR